MHQNINPKAPPMTAAEFERAGQICFERCAGCHGVLRGGATGKALTPDITLGKGTDYLKVFIAYGSPAGMPNWQTSGEMSEQDGFDGALHPARAAHPPEFSLADIEKTRKIGVPVEQRPTRKMNHYNLDNLFSVTLRDSGEVALIDGDTKQIINNQNWLRQCISRGCPNPAAILCDWPRRAAEPDRFVDGCRTMWRKSKVGLEARSVETSKFRALKTRSPWRHLLAAAVCHHGRATRSSRAKWCPLAA